MQLKKMRAILPTLCSSQVNKEHGSLTTSPKQKSVDKANPITTKEKNQNGSYQQIEEIKLNQITCIKCRCVQETSALDLPKRTCQPRGDNHYVCNKCLLNLPSVGNSVTAPIGVSNTENKEKGTPGKILRTFLAKNLQPDKHYCDKCRFSTKDPLQFKKHITQHEEIKFVCSYCGCVSYTKGEFQRHLVKHTGKFPYRCKYCEYGAIRHDYIVKHIQRLHKTVADKQVKLTVEKAEQTTNCLTKQNAEKKRVSQEVPLQNKSSNASFNTVQEETPEIVCTSSTPECSQGAQFIQEENVIEPSDIGIHKNENVEVVEVEVYSPQNEPLMPGMPLTVVAPAKFVVPPNCLAEIVDIKSVNGVQWLILKLIPEEETISRPAQCPVAEHANQSADQGETTTSGSMSPTFASSRTLGNECCSDSGHVGSPSSTALNPNSINMHKKNVKCNESEERANNLTATIAELSPDQRNSGEFILRRKYPKHRYLNFDFSSFKCLAPSSSEGGDVPQNSLLDAVQENNGVSPSSVLDTKHCALSNVDGERCNKLPVANTPSFDSSHPLERNAEWQQNKPVCLDGSKAAFATANEKLLKSEQENICLDSSEAQNVKNEGESSEGPVISSVFSLSSGTVNIPEGIQWDNTLPKKSSASLLCRKIAQLMSAAESNAKSQLATSLSQDKSPPKEKKILSPEIPVKLEGCDSTTESEPAPVLSPQRSNNVTSSNEHSSREERAQPLEVPKPARTKKRMVNKTHASPVFIPQGTVLRVFDCVRTEGFCDQGNWNETLASPILFSSDTFLPRPVPCSVAENGIKTLSLVPAQNSVTKTSKNRSVSHWRRKKWRGKKRKHMKKRKQNRVLPYPEGSAINMSNEGENLTKKSLQSQEDCYIIKVEPLLTRHLRLVPFKRDQLIKCPHRNQPVIVLNHPDVDPPEIINVMKVINKYKVNVVKAVLSERTIRCLGAKRHHKRLTFQDFDRVAQMRKLNMLKMKLKKIHRNAYEVVDSTSKQTFQCWFCGRTYVDQEEWISHGQKHLMEATRGWDGPSGPVESDEEEICVV